MIKKLKLNIRPYSEGVDMIIWSEQIYYIANKEENCSELFSLKWIVQSLDNKREIENLNIEKTRLENTLNSIHNINEIYVTIKQVVKQEIESTIFQPWQLIRCVLAALFESSRKHPGKFQAMYYNMSSPLSVEQIFSESSISQNASRYRYSEDENEKVLLDEAELSYNRIVDAITNHCINQTPKIPNDNNTGLPPETFQIAGIQGIENNSEIFDTSYP